LKRIALMLIESPWLIINQADLAYEINVAAAQLAREDADVNRDIEVVF